MATKTFTFQARIATDKFAQDTAQMRKLIEAAYAPVRIDTTSATQLVEVQRQALQETVQIEQAVSAERRAEIQKEVIARREAANLAGQVARSSANERTEIARQQTATVNEAERRTTIAFAEEERRKTALLKAELTKRNTDTRVNLGALAGNLDSVLGLATGGLAAYGAVQAIQAIGTAAKDGAGQLRFAQVFEQQAQRVGVSAQQMLQAIQTASNGTIRESQAMALGAQLLSQRFAESMDDIVGDTQTLIEFSRRASQLYTDESGNLLSTQDVYGRLLKFVREGNKELVDQFGISNQAIADFLDIPVQGLAGSNGAASRIKGLVGIAKQENERLGESIKTVADDYEQASKTIAEAGDEIKQVLAPFVASILKDASSGLKQIVVGLGAGTLNNDISSVAGRIEYLKGKIDDLKGGKGIILRDIFGGDAGRNDAISGLEKELESVEILKKLLSEIGSNPALDKYKERLRDAAKEIVNTGTVSAATAASLEIINRISESYAKAIGIVGEATFKTNAEAQALAAELEKLDAQVNNGTISYLEYYRAVDQVEGKLRDIKDAADTLAQKKGPGGGFLSFLGTEELATLDEQFAEAGQKVKESIQATRDDLLQAAQQQANAILEGGGSYDEALAFLRQKEGEIAQFFRDLPKNITPQQLELQSVKFKVDNIDPNTDSLTQESDKILADVQKQLESAVADGLDPQTAVGLINGYKQRITEAIAQIPAGISEEELAFRLAAITKTFDDELGKLSESLNANLADIEPQEAIDRIVGAIDDLDSAAADGIPGLGKIKDDLSGLLADIMESGQVTEEQAAQLDNWAAAAAAAGDETGFFADAISGLGFEFFNNDTQASNLISRMAQLDAAYQTGQITSGQYAGQLSVLLKALYDVAINAGVAKETLDQMFGSANAFITSNSGQSDFAQGQGQGQLVTQFEALFAAQQRREQERREAERETTRLQQDAARAMKEAAQQNKSDVSSTPGLFGVSQVTAEQMALADAGVPQQFADDFLRQLADLIENGVQRPGVSIERARGALENVGVQTAGLSDKALFEILKQKWADSSLFADPNTFEAVNLDLINFGAVEKQLALKQQGREGMDNIYDEISRQTGLAFDVVQEAVSSGKVKAPTGTTGAPSKAESVVRGVEQPLTATIDPKALLTAFDQLSAQVASPDILKKFASAGTDGAKAFEESFAAYDFSPLASYPVAAMEAAMIDGKIADRIGALGARMADTFINAAETRVGERDVFGRLVSAIEARVTNNVLNALAE